MTTRAAWRIPSGDFITVNSGSTSRNGFTCLYIYIKYNSFIYIYIYKTDIMYKPYIMSKPYTSYTSYDYSSGVVIVVLSHQLSAIPELWN